MASFMLSLALIKGPVRAVVALDLSVESFECISRLIGRLGDSEFMRTFEMTSR